MMRQKHWPPEWPADPLSVGERPPFEIFKDAESHATTLGHR
jgi:hypothetical protein